MLYLLSYLRPETAQGHFLNFSRLLLFNNGRLPFASAQIGRSFRNEISPRAGLLRVREFTMAEIEHFVDPLDKKHARFDEIQDLKVMLLPKEVQSAGRKDLLEISIGEAVSKVSHPLSSLTFQHLMPVPQNIIDNETLGYFLGRTYLFLIKVGINPQRLRFRQHMANEMAHYAADCWDAEIETSYGWIECVGCADRSAYDLTVHSNKTGQALVAQVTLPEPVIEEKIVVEFNKKNFGRTFTKESDVVKNAIDALDQDSLLKLQSELLNG